MQSHSLMSAAEQGQQADSNFRVLFFHNPLPMWMFDRDTLRFIEVNDAAVKHYGYSRDEFLDMNLADIRPPEDVARLHASRDDWTRQPANKQSRFHRSPGWRHLRKDKSLLWVDVYSHDFWYGGRLVRLSMVYDVTPLKHVAERLAEQSAFFSQLFHNSPEAIVMLDESDAVVDANDAFIKLFQYSLEEMKGRQLNGLIVPPEYLQEASALSLSALQRSSVHRDTVRRRKDGSHVDVSALGYPITLGERKVGVFAIYRDITESKRISAELAFHSTHDPLTGLINRHEFERRASARLQWGGRSKMNHAMLYMDVDQFKIVNDSCGHVAGDRMLVELAELLRTQLREAESLARLGGDEFGVLLNGTTLEEAGQIAERLVQAVRDWRFKWDGRVFTPGLSIGVVALGGEIGTLKELMSAADTACFAAKDRGRSRVQVYSPDDQDLAKMRGELSWASRITDALENNRFTLYYQRILPVAYAAVQEARHASRGEILLRMVEAGQNRIVLPGVFISAAERYGLMPQVDRYVIDNVFRQMQAAGPHKINGDVVSINVSGTSLSDSDFSRHIREQFERYKLKPGSICFEITETAAIGNMGRALKFISDMRALGCSIALDDFGSGMSSFTYLKSFTVDYVKIDGSFVRDMVNNPLDCATAEAINKVAQVKGLKTVAEFVENEETLVRLRDLGVNYAQGYHLHRPEPWKLN